MQSGLSEDPRLQYNWKVQMGNCSTPNSNGCTTFGTFNGFVTTTIDNGNYRYASELSIAKTKGK